MTKNPTDDYAGSIGLELGELNRRRFEGSIGGPFSTRPGTHLNRKLMGLHLFLRWAIGHIAAVAAKEKGRCCQRPEV